MAFDEGVVRLRARRFLDNKCPAMMLVLKGAVLDALMDVIVDVAAESYGDGISDQQDAQRPG